MDKIAINPGTLAPPVGHFDRAVKMGPWLFISGTSALTHVTGEMSERKLSATIEEQVRETLTNIGRRLRGGGLFARRRLRDQVHHQAPRRLQGGR